MGSHAPMNGGAQPYFTHTPSDVELYIFQMQSLAASQGLFYDPVSHAMFAMDPSGMSYMVANSSMLPPFSAFVPPFVPTGAEGEVLPEGFVEEGEILETGGVDGGEPAEQETVEVVAPVVEPTEPVADAAPAPAPVASTGKYVPPNRSAAAAATSEPVVAAAPAVEQLVQKAAALTISADDDADTPVDIEVNTGDSLRYPKQAILALFSSEGVVIPAILKEFYKTEDFEKGSVDGSSYFRAPLPSVLTLADSGATFSGGQAPGRKASNNNLRGGSSSSNLERSASNSSFGRHDNNNRRNNNNNNRDRDNRDRETGEILEGEEGYVEDAPRENRKSKKNQNNPNLPPPVYKSRFQLDSSDPMLIVRNANGILNKLSITNFDKLSDEFLVLLQTLATTEDSMRRGVEALVTKAQMEENFCFIYADLCRKIIDTWVALEPEDNTFSTAAEEGEDGETPAAAAEGDESTPKKELRTMGKIFKESLLQRCQNEFEFDHIAVLKEIRENVDFSPEDRNEKEILLKKRITGHMRFIGELYMKDLIKANVIKSCCLDVLIESVQEEELVCLCKLFQTLGARLEKYFLDKSRQKKNKSKNMQDIIPQYFERVLQIAEVHPSSRVRFMLRDLADMRSNDWTARREEEKMVSLDKDKKPESQEQFKPVVTPYVSGDARSQNAEPAVDEWSVVQTVNKKKPTGAPSPVPPAALSRSGSSAQMARGNSSSGNLSGMDKRRPAPAAAPAAGGSAAGPRKEKSNANGREGRGAVSGGSAKGPRGSSGPRTASVSPVPTEAAETAVVTFTSDLAEICKKARSAAKEFYRNGMVEEATLTFQEVNPLPTLMGDVVKDLICQCIDQSSEKDCGLLCTLFAALREVFVADSSAPILSAEQVKEGVLKFLNVVDELCIDVPKAVSTVLYVLHTVLMFVYCE